MRDGIYTPLGLRALPAEAETRENSPFRPGALGAFFSLAAAMLWFAVSGFWRRA